MIGATTDAESDCADVVGADADGNNDNTVGTCVTKSDTAESDCKTSDATDEDEDDACREEWATGNAFELAKLGATNSAFPDCTDDGGDEEEEDDDGMGNAMPVSKLKNSF